MGPRPQVVVIGAGFGGLHAVGGLREADVDVTVVDRENYHTFLPLLYQVATAGLNPADVAHPVRGIFHDQRNVAFRHATVIGADWDDRHLLLDSPDGRRDHLPFDQLIVAAGSAASFFDIPGAAQHSYPLYTLADATALRNHVLGRFEAVDADPALVDSGALTFVVVGGGPTGVEVAGALAELFAQVLRRDFAAVDVARARVVLVEMAPTLLAPFHEESRWHAFDALRARGVEIRLERAVAEVGAESVRLDSGEVIAAHTLVWAAGVRGNPVAEALGLPVGRGGRIDVGPDLSVPGHPGVWAIGDVANIAAVVRPLVALPWARGTGTPRAGTLPQLAPVAMQTGAHAAAQVVATLAGRPTEGFAYVDRGTMATIGRRSAVAELPFGIRLSGTLAWFAWLGLHLLFLVGFRNRLSVFLNWAWNYLTWDRGPRLILTPRRR
ncbi:MAG TPA: NAD(P)/FAD-dependent oxidoreductase [Acidimicrobiales bacterium]|nr:NAD(P)/FAD-dependent oxidoreductase [Acidimicrobiales bacterium]